VSPPFSPEVTVIRNPTYAGSEQLRIPLWNEPEAERYHRKCVE
jgi:hypothetical protein